MQVLRTDGDLQWGGGFSHTFAHNLAIYDRNILKIDSHQICFYMTGFRFSVNV